MTGRLALLILATMMIGSLMAGCGEQAKYGATAGAGSGKGASHASDAGSASDAGTHAGGTSAAGSESSGAASSGDSGESAPTASGPGAGGKPEPSNSAAAAEGQSADAGQGAGQGANDKAASAANSNTSVTASGTSVQAGGTSGTNKADQTGQKSADAQAAASANQGQKASSQPASKPSGQSPAAKPADTTTDKPAKSQPGSTAAASTSNAPAKAQTKPPQTQPTAPPVKLDKPTAPVMAYTGKSGAKLVALTFDDGPDSKYTPAILDILKAQHVPATFFTVGIQVKRYATVMKRIVKEGHEIGNHSYSHPNLSKLDSTPILNQIKWTDTLIGRDVGFVPKLVRAPYGAASPLLKKIVADNGRVLINWTVDTRDWEGSPVEAMRANVNRNTHPGGIILMHSFGSKHIGNTVKLLPLVIKDLRLKGYTFVTVSELLDAKAQSKQAAAKKK